MQRASFHRLMARLALLAMLLLALMPTLGRLLPDAAGAGAGLTPMCTLSGLQLLPLPEGPAVRVPAAPLSPFAIDRPAPKPLAAMGGDCAYCPLLNAMAALVVCLLLAFPQALADLLPKPGRVALRRRWPSGTLGSRGPPAR